MQEKAEWSLVEITREYPCGQNPDGTHNPFGYPCGFGLIWVGSRDTQKYCEGTVGPVARGGETNAPISVLIGRP